jgi:16S rRNA (guanine527-N7)-methyltransferase
VPGFDARRGGEAIERIAAELGAELGASERHALLAYVQLIASWNQRTNLTAARGEPALCEVLLVDAIVVSRGDLIERDASLLDVGTGAGAPIMPLLQLRPDLRATCVEPLHKRSALLRTASVRLGLHARMTVSEQSIDPARPIFAGSFSLSLSRATFEPAVWLQVGLALAPSVLVFLAGDATPPVASGAGCVRTQAYRLPLSGAPRCVALYERRP